MHVLSSAKSPTETKTSGSQGRALLYLPEPVEHACCLSPSLPLETLTCGAIQTASRSEEATFEFVRKTKNKKKTTKAPNQTNTARHGRCFLPPAPCTIWCGGPGKLGHRWRAWDQPCFLNTRFLSVNDNAQTHGAAWLPGGSGIHAFLGLAPRVRLSPSRWQAGESLKTNDADAGTQMRTLRSEAVGPSDPRGATTHRLLSCLGPRGTIMEEMGRAQEHLQGTLERTPRWGWDWNPALGCLCS